VPLAGNVLPDGSPETKDYDDAGNLEARTDFMGRTTTTSTTRTTA
jgi:YD repeat-containing protein